MSKMRSYSRVKLKLQNIENVQSLCRLCLERSEELTPIFSTDVEYKSPCLSLRIISSLGLEVSQDDTLPKNICHPCVSLVDKFYNFKQNCTSNYWKLKVNLVKDTTLKYSNSGDEPNEEATRNTSVLYKDQKYIENKICFTESSKQNNISFDQQQMHTTTTLVSEKICTDNNIHHERTLGENEETRTVLEEDIRETDDRTIIPVAGEPTELSSQNLQVKDEKVRQETGNDNQIDETILNNIFDVVPEQNGEGTANVQTAECLSEYTVRVLGQKGVLVKRDDGLQILDPNIKILHLETSYGSNIVMELVEEDSEMTTETSPILQHNTASSSNKRVCGECGAQFGSRGALVRHQRVHTGERPYACCTCARRFAQPEVLRRHQLLHADKLPYQCASCPKAYTQRGALEAHARKHAPAGSRALELHRCAHCPKVFLYPSGLSRHMSVHRGRAYSCEVCSRTFNDNSSLKRHRKAHQRARST